MSQSQTNPQHREEKLKNDNGDMTSIAPQKNTDISLLIS